MDTESLDVLVIGAGPAGYTAAIRAKQLGLKVMVVERSEIGGTCLNRGCIPSKALIHCAKLWRQINQANRFGIFVSDAKFDWQAMRKWSDRVVTSLRRGLQSLLQRHGVTVFSGIATPVAPDEVQLEASSGETSTVHTKSIVLACGSSPILLPCDPEATVFTEEQALFLNELPENIIVVGGGPSGIELAWLFNALGSHINLVEMLPHLLPQVDLEIADGLRFALEKQGIVVKTQAKVEQIQSQNTNAVVRLQDGVTLKADAVICAIGRKANSESLKWLGVELDDRKNVLVNSCQQTSIPSIFAIGDVVHGGGTAHGGMEEGSRAAEAIQSYLKRTELTPLQDTPTIPFCVYCEPQVLRVGITENEAKQQGRKVTVIRFPWRACGATMVTGEVEGFVKLVVEETSQKVLGVHILGSDVTNLNGEASLIVGKGLTAQQASEIIRQHPSLSEGIGEALWSAIGLPLHVPYGR